MGVLSICCQSVTDVVVSYKSLNPAAKGVILPLELCRPKAQHSTAPDQLSKGWSPNLMVPGYLTGLFGLAAHRRGHSLIHYFFMIAQMAHVYRDIFMKWVALKY